MSQQQEGPTGLSAQTRGGRRGGGGGEGQGLLRGVWLGCLAPVISAEVGVLSDAVLCLCLCPRHYPCLCGSVLCPAVPAPCLGLCCACIMLRCKFTPHPTSIGNLCAHATLFFSLLPHTQSQPADFSSDHATLCSPTSKPSRQHVAHTSMHSKRHPAQRQQGPQGDRHGYAPSSAMQGEGGAERQLHSLADSWGAPV